jgi:hypothetical protein
VCRRASETAAGAGHVFRPREVADKDLRARLAQRLGALVVTADKGADRKLAAEQDARDHAANAAHLARGSGYQYW